MSEISVACGVLFSFGNTNNYRSSCLPPAKFYLPLCNINTRRTQSINIMKRFMRSSWKGLIEWACIKHYSLTQDHLYFLCTIYVVHLQVHPPHQCLCSSTCFCPEFLATSANRIWIHFSVRQTSKEGLRLCCCQ